AGNSLWIQRDAAGNASGSVLNSSGTIETQRGDITVRTGTLTNQREGLVVTESGSTAADMPDWAGGTTAQIPVSWFKEGDLGYYKYQNCNATNGDRDREVCGRTSYFYVPYKSADSQKINIVSSEIKVVAQGSEGIIKSGEDIYFSSDVMVNSSSTISAERDINLTGSILNNVSYQSGYYEKSLSYVYRLNRVDNNDDLTYIDIRVNDPERFNIRPNIEVGSDLYTKLKTDNNVRYNYVLYYLDGDTSQFVSGQTYAATLQAGGAITASFSQNISNTSLQPGSGGFMPALTTPTLAGVSAFTPVGAQAGRELSGGTA
ncbi:filamentous hemagglutinin, partial [Dickeya chrysanthemi]|nr:filamentous hemagglutinin [Dickeya chrysanthemi]